MLFFNLFTIKYLGKIVKTIVLLKGDGAKLIDIPNYNYSFDSFSESILITPLIPTWLRSIPKVGLKYNVFKDIIF
jgi:hypothetical protein